MLTIHRVIAPLSRACITVALLLHCKFADGQSIRKAATVTLSNGQVITALSTFSPKPAGKLSTVVFIGDSGAPVTVTEQTDLAWNQLDLSLSDGERRLTMRFHIGFVEDGMAGPAELKIDSKVFRWLAKPSGETTTQKRAMQTAVAALPENVRKDLITFASLCGSAMADLVLPASGLLISELFEEPLPRVAAQSIKVLTSEDIGRLFRDSGGESAITSRQ